MYMLDFRCEMGISHFSFNQFLVSKLVHELFACGGNTLGWLEIFLSFYFFLCDNVQLYIDLLCDLFLSFSHCDRTESSSFRNYRSVFEKGYKKTECCSLFEKWISRVIKLIRAALYTNFNKFGREVAENWRVIEKWNIGKFNLPDAVRT